MQLPEIEYQFYGAQITDISIGPRQELELTLELWSQTNGNLSNSFRQGEGMPVSVRFGGIHNFEQVKKFLGKWKEDTNHPGLHYLRYSQDKHSRLGDLFLEIEFDSTEDYVEIHCRNFMVTPL